MVLSPALNIRSTRGPLYDADALAYCRASGATNRKAISDFVRGVKALGLWSSLVCWPLRSSQNAGTGTTAYSLGGLGTFNGTLTNGPVWTSDGITFDGSNDLISVDNPLKSTALAAYSIWSVFDAAVATNQAVIGSFYVSSGTAGPVMFAGGSPIQGGSGGQLYHEVSSNGSTTIGSGGGKAAASGNTGAWQTAFAGFSATEVGLSYNAVTRGTSSVSSTTCWNDNATWRMGQRLLDGGYTFNGQQAFNAVLSIYLTVAQEESIRSIYKSTLGIGLGLP